MKSTHQIIAENPRIMWAVLGSMLLHATVISPWFTARPQASPSRPFETIGFAASLAARIAGVKEAESESDPGRSSKPLAAPPPSVAVEQPAPAFVVPVQEGGATESETLVFPADAGEGDADGPRGVSVTEMLFHRAPPADFRKRLSEFPGYFTSPQLTRRPEALNVVLPTYPAKELATRSSTWIVVALFIDEKGGVVAAIPVDGDEGYEVFQDQVAAALGASTFRSGERFGLPVKSMIFQMVEFRPPETPLDAPSAGVSAEVTP